MDETYENIIKHIRISVRGDYGKMLVGRAVLRVLNYPSYICFRVNRKWTSLIILPCESKESLSFQVPDRPFGKDGTEFVITSKSFISGLVERNGLELNKNYMIPGKYVEKEKCVVFNIADGFEHMMPVKEYNDEAAP
ncbi:MAG: hypothetical protein IJJ64_05425 [Butyrivibrio sp.]|nr:hypothetical protein [Butyrivibrio sp.]